MKPANLSNLFLFAVSFTYLCAFSSLYIQIPGLYGDQGLLPVTSVTTLCSKDQPIWRCLAAEQKPSLLMLAPFLGLNAPDMMELLCICGMILSSLSLVFGCLRDAISYAGLWLLYFSCFQVGQTFLWFQWDTLLLETGFLTILVAPFGIFRRLFGFRALPHDHVTLFLVRWLLFRYIFASGIVKLTSECPTWWGLTALHWHFESQCIPTSAAWWAHQLPDWIKQFGVMATFVIEIFVPLLFLLPIRNLRVFAAAAQILLQVLIIITGNYNFFNVTTFALCLPLLIDVNSSKFGTHTFLRQRLGKTTYRILASVISGSVYALLLYATIVLFGLRVDLEHLRITSKIGFNPDALTRNLTWSVWYVIVFGAVMFGLEISAALIRCFADIKKGFLCSKRVVSLLACIVICVASSFAFVISLVPISWLDKGAENALGPVVRGLYEKTAQFEITHSYGLFRSMTGVGGRPEIIIEGSRDNQTWFEYEFLYKPGSLNRAPPFIAPHQPRLDWQIWFAALSDYQRNPWFVSLMYRLLTTENTVLNLLDKSQLPKYSSVKYIRAHLYHYHYTSLTDSDPQHQTNYWWREWQSEYFPITTLESAKPLVDYLRQSGKIISNPTKSAATFVPDFLTTVRQSAELLPHHIFVWAVLAASVLANLSLGFFLGSFATPKGPGKPGPSSGKVAGKASSQGAKAKR